VFIAGVGGHEQCVLGAVQIGRVFALAVDGEGLDRSENGRVVERGERGGQVARLPHRPDLTGRLQVFGCAPPPRHGLDDRVRGARNREQRLRHAEPCVRGAEQHRLGFCAARLASPQVGMPAAAGRHLGGESILVEGVGHAALLAAFRALDLNVDRRARRAVVAQRELRCAVFGPPVYEPVPGEVIQMPVLAGQKETGGHHARRVDLRAGAVEMHERRAVRSEPIDLELDEAARNGRQQLAHRTSQKLWERGDGHAPVPLVERLGEACPPGRYRRGDQVRHLRAEAAPHGVEQPLLGDAFGAHVRRPVVESHHDGRHIGQVDHGADAERVEHLTRA
jgi:hypothetical protein